MMRPRSSIALVLLVACGGPPAATAPPAATTTTDNAGDGGAPPANDAATPPSATGANAPPPAEPTRWKIVKEGAQCAVLAAPHGCLPNERCGPVTRPIGCPPGVNQYPLNVERKPGATTCTTNLVQNGDPPKAVDVPVPCPDAT